MSAPDARHHAERRGPSDDGAHQVWGLISTLVAGPAVWGAVGYGIDAAADSTVFTPVGVVVGFLTSFYIVYVRAVREPAPAAPTRTQHGRTEVPTRDAARPEPGDGR